MTEDRTRLARRITGSLAAGAVLTVLVAIAFLPAGSNARTAEPDRYISTTPWPEWVPATWTAPPAQHILFRSWGYRTQAWQRVERGSSWRFASNIQIGFPFLSLGARETYELVASNQNVWTENVWTDSARRSRRSGFPPATVPIRPLYPGFALNTLLYATTLFLLWSTPALIRRHRRTRRGLCANCAYDLKATPPNAPCPECGHPPSPRPERAAVPSRG